MGFIEVRPSDDDIRDSRVSLWEKDADDHSKADPRWSDDDKGFGGAYIAGNPKQPEATYVVADTPYVRKAIKDGRLVLVANEATPRTAQPIVAPVIVEPVAPVVPAPVVSEPAPVEPVAPVADATPDSTDAPAASGKKGK